MNIIRIDLLKYRGDKSSLFTGRPQGVKARGEVGLDTFDKDDNKYILVIPKGTTSFNPSFFLGLLFNSIKKLGVNKFNDKYSFDIEDKEIPSTVENIQSNIDDGFRNAINSIEKKSVFSNLF